MHKFKTESKNVNQLMQEEKKHIVVVDSIVNDLNTISEATGIPQQRISLEVFKAGLPKVIRKHQLINEQNN